MFRLMTREKYKARKGDGVGRRESEKGEGVEIEGRGGRERAMLKRERERERDRQTDRQTDRDRESQRQREGGERESQREINFNGLPIV